MGSKKGEKNENVKEIEKPPRSLVKVLGWFFYAERAVKVLFFCGKVQIHINLIKKLSAIKVLWIGQIANYGAGLVQK